MHSRNGISPMLATMMASLLAGDISTSSLPGAQVGRGPRIPEYEPQRYNSAEELAVANNAIEKARAKRMRKALKLAIS